jgi:hypothetical protein
VAPTPGKFSNFECQNTKENELKLNKTEETSRGNILIFLLKAKSDLLSFQSSLN